jgi:hypothetical protein
MRIPYSRLLAAAGFVLAASLGLTAAGARFWQVSTQAEFLRGEVENLSIDLHGRLVLGPETAMIGESATPFIWRIVPAPGGGVFAGSGNDGQVFRFAADGTRTMVFDAPEVSVHALATAPNGVLYVGTSPDGRIYRIDATGASTVYFDPPDKYIWSLATDAKGVLYAATGEKGLIYRITAEGRGETFYETKSTHVMTLLFEPNGDLLAGTQAPGRVFRIRPDASGFVLLDPGLEEIGTLRRDEGGAVYAAGFTGRPPSPPERPAQPERPAEPSAPAPVATVSTEITVVAVDVPAAGVPTQTPRAERRTVRGGVYRIAPDGSWDVVWESADDVPYDVLPAEDGALLVATGHTGKVYRIEGDPVRITLLARADAQQVTGLLRQPGGEIWLATSNPGKLFRMSSAPARRGTYVSEVRDAEMLATWGAISWRGSVPQASTVRLFTRSGNTPVPDDTWSPWSDAYTQADGQNITSPRARYLQWKLELAGTAAASPLVTSVTAAYLQRNARPQVTSITVHPPGVVFQKPFSTGDLEIAGFDGTAAERRASATASGAAAAGVTAPPGPPLGRRIYQKGLQTFMWRAEDSNDDELRYDVFYRREGETTWKPLRRGLEEAIYVWDTTAVPNGTYVLRVAASDAPSNPGGSALVGERESRAFDVDNSAPTITVSAVTRTAQRTVVTFTVEDDHSPLQRVEYSLDADRWRPTYPKDGIADSRREEFELVIETDTTGRAIILRAIDAMNNVVTTRAEAGAGR